MAEEVFQTSNGGTYLPKDRVPLTDKQIEKLVGDAGEKVGQLASKVVDTSSRTLLIGKKFAKEHPKTTLAIALMSGVVIGGALSLTMRQRQ